MTKSVMHRLAKVVLSRIKRSFAVLKTVNGAHIKVGLVELAAWLPVLCPAYRRNLTTQCLRSPAE
jgi:hypothetical protein